MMTYNILVPSGTVVVASMNASNGVVSRGTIRTVADSYIDNATRDGDGSFSYCIGKRCFTASSGTVKVLKNHEV